MDEMLFDKIEAWLRGKLPPAEAAAFEAEIAADPELAELVRVHRLEQQGLEWLVERDLRAKMNAWVRTAEEIPQPAVVRRPVFVQRWRIAAAAAAVVLAGIFGWWLLRPQADVGGPTPIVTVPKPKTPVNTPPKTAPKPLPKPPAGRLEEEDRVAETPRSSPPASGQPPAVTRPTTPSPSVNPPPATVDYSALAASYYREQDFIKRNGNTADEPAGYGQALDSYESGKFPEVEKLLKPVLKLNPNALKAKELLAHSLYKNRRYDAAIPYFRQLSTARDKAVAERSEWALALALLHKMPARKADLNRTLDQILRKPGHAFYDKARALKAQIR